MILANPVRSAPAASMNGFPVIAIAAMSVRASAASRARFSSSRPRAPKVFGRVGPRPLSSVINTAVPAAWGSVTSRLNARVTTSPSLLAEASVISWVELRGPHAAASSSAEKCGFSQITVPPIPRPIHMVVIP